MVLGTITPPSAAAPRHRVVAASRFRSPHALQLTGSGSGKPIKIRDRKAIKQGDRAHTGQITDIPSDPDAPGNLFAPVPGTVGAHGRFNKQARVKSWEMFTSRHRSAAWAAVFVGAALGAHLLAQRLKV
jgi:hypothetical protein